MSFQEGQNVMRCEPYTYAVREEQTSSVCDWCMIIREKLQFICSACKMVYYCSKFCQTNAWHNHHKLECKILKKSKLKKYCKGLSVDESSIPSEFAKFANSSKSDLLAATMNHNNNLVLTYSRLMARTILKLYKDFEEGKEQAFVILPNGRKRSFDDLISHENQVLQKPQIRQGFEQCYSTLREWFGEKLPSREEILDIYAKVLLNSIDILENGILSKGKGLYLDASVIKHSCYPNAKCAECPSGNGKVKILRTLDKVSVNFFISKFLTFNK